MKKIFTLLITLASSISLCAFHGPSKLGITSISNDNIRVMVDGNKYRTTNNALTIDDLDAGFHTIKIFRVKRSPKGFNDRSFGRFEQIYNTRIYIKPQYFVDIVINRFGKVFIDEQVMGAGQYNDEEDDWDETGNADAGNDGEPYVGNAMSNASFERFKQSLRNEGFDNTKAVVAKQVISSNYFTAQQVKEIVEQFTYESSKLDIAKFSFKYTVDKGSYFIVSDALTYSVSKQELIGYIQANK